MILLESLYAKNFKALKEVSIAFPERGSVLIEGLNESGKSTLFESIYFGLYGRPLVTEEGNGGLDGIIRYDGDAAQVDLVIRVDATRIAIHRSLQRGKSQQVTLLVERPGQGRETVRYVNRANALIVAEMGNLDEAALLNSCFVEQKKLDKLEDLSRSERLESLMKLLNLEKLQQLERQFKPTRQDEEAVARARLRLHLAEAAARLPGVEAARLEVEERLRAVALLAAFAAIDAHQARAQQAQARLAGLAKDRAFLSEQLEFLEKLRRADGLVGAVLQALQRQADEERRARAVEAEILELDEKEQEVLPRREERLRQFEGLARAADRWHALDSQRQEAQREVEQVRQRRAEFAQQAAEAQRLRDERERAQPEVHDARAEVARLEQLEAEELPRLERDLRDLRERADRLADLEAATGIEDLDAARRGLREARENLRLADIRAALQQWVNLKRAAEALERSEALRLREEARLQDLEVQRDAAAAAHRRSRLVAGGVALVGLVGLALSGYALLTASSLADPGTSVAVTAVAWLVVLIALGGMAWSATTMRRRGATRAAAAARVAEQQQVLTRVEARHLAAEEMGGDPESLRRCQERLETLREGVPSSLFAADGRLDQLNQRLGGLDAAALEAAQVSSLARARALEDDLKARVTRAEHEVQARRDELGRLPAARGRLQRLEDHQHQRSERIAALVAAVESDEARKLPARESECRAAAAALGREQERLAEGLRPVLALFDLPLDPSRVRQTLGQAEAEVRALQDDLARRDGLRVALAQHRESVDERGREVRAHERELEALGLPGLPLPVGSGERAYRERRARIQQAQRTGDEPAMRTRLARVEQAIGAAAAEARQAQGEVARLREEIGRLLPSTVEQRDPATREAAVAVWPLLSEVGPEQREPLTVERDRLIGEAAALQRTCADLRARLLLDDAPLDVDECREELAAEEHRLEVRRLACELVVGVRARMVAKVLPNTEHNMRSILPLLTAGRYHEARIDQDRFRIRVFDETAQRYVSKNIFSGGTRDQFSLALRLAFALATLPQELGTTPGFIFLDEPLSSFDEPRTRALVDLLTNGQIADNFNQIFVISHSRSFDPSLFTHHVTMVDGEIDWSDTTLPRADGLPAEQQSLALV